MKFRLRCVALTTAALQWSAVTASAESYAVFKQLSSTATNVTAKGKRMVFMGGFVSDGSCLMTAQNVIMTYPFMPAPVVVYTGHTGTLNTSQVIQHASVQREVSPGVFEYHFEYHIVTPTLIP